MLDFYLSLTGTTQVGWGVIVLLFLTLEGVALANTKRGDTWSEVLRYAFGFSKRSPLRGWFRVAGRGLFFVLAAWFTYHIGLS